VLNLQSEQYAAECIRRHTAIGNVLKHVGCLGQGDRLESVCHAKL
jgi:hypothetical protein